MLFVCLFICLFLLCTQKKVLYLLVWVDVCAFFIYHNRLVFDVIVVIVVIIIIVIVVIVVVGIVVVIVIVVVVVVGIDGDDYLERKTVFFKTFFFTACIYMEHNEYF